MAKAKLFELPETRGVFQIKGLVTGRDKENFYKESKTKTNKDMRRVNFGVTFDEDKTVYVNLQGFPMDNVYFSKSAQKGEKSEVVKVAWTDRHTFNREGFRLIGNNIGLQKITDQKGNQVNDKKVLTDFDSCKEIAENLKDNQSVFIKGKLEYSSFKTDKGDQKKSTKLVPNQISLCQAVDFTDEKFKPAHDFTQTIVFMGIEQEKENDKPTGRFIVSAKIVGYSTIEDAEFIISDSKLAQLFRKNLKPYTAIEVWGKLEVLAQTEEIEDEDEWGEANSMTKQTAPTRREFIITGAKKSSIDTDTYTEELVEAAIAAVNNAKTAKKDFGETDRDTWGSSSALGSNDEDDEAWD